jgi:hypothetical protein
VLGTLKVLKPSIWLLR